MSRNGTVQVEACDGMVQVGSWVRVRDVDGEEQFAVVPPEDADITTRRISSESPLGRALLGRRAGEEVRFRGPGGLLSATIVHIHTGAAL
jgi:transcription elongation GreA/GreB family factor